MLRKAFAYNQTFQTIELAGVATQNDPQASHFEAPCRMAVPASVADHVTLWRLSRPGDYFRPGEVNALTKEDWAEIGAVRDGSTRRRSLGMRLFLREALSAAVDGAVDPGQWRFVRSVYGKPLIADGLPQIDFSISHSESQSLLAISRTAKIGVDVEAEAVSGWQEIAAELFSRHERATLDRAPPADRPQTFLSLWTVKEAYSKLLGVGLAFDAPANDCGSGTHLASWTAQTPSGPVVVSLAVDPLATAA
jgi:phosphopantetheinyl transferase